MTDIARATSLLRSGGLVAFPTETVYGLGADATNAAAVARIFAAKGRPSTNPLIVHVANVDVARRYATTWPDGAQPLAERFWPGPLSIVLPKVDSIVEGVSAGKRTVGLRVPSHPVALELLKSFGGPVAAPSANRSNHISPTTAQHVRDELGDAVDLILDGGPCDVGIESSVIDLSGEEPILWRPGGVAKEAIEEVLGRPVRTVNGNATAGEAAASPGQLATHYAPVTPAYRFETSQRKEISVEIGGVACGIMALSPLVGMKKWGPIVAMSADPIEYAQHLYEVMRELDAMDLAAIFIEYPPEEPRWAAVRDRIQRATTPLEPRGRGIRFI